MLKKQLNSVDGETLWDMESGIQRFCINGLLPGELMFFLEYMKEAILFVNLPVYIEISAILSAT